MGQFHCRGCKTGHGWLLTKLVPESVEPAEVTLHVYNVLSMQQCRAVNTVLKVMGTGIFHCGIEVHDREWSYEGYGVYCCIPRMWRAGSHFEAMPLGMTKLGEADVFRILDRLEREGWTGDAYDLLEQNCCHFSDQLTACLGVDGVPEWVMSLAKSGVAVRRTVERVAGCGCGARYRDEAGPPATMETLREATDSMTPVLASCSGDEQLSEEPVEDVAASKGSPRSPPCSPAPLRPPRGKAFVQVDDDEY
mmetsp:Transcript_66416/g.130949  ORF Transcript_66416/g.130949 Transcript_66416/m.130949 type:complete len:250 (-) Transcript_66416:28-777(-)